ncbi:MAG: exosortase-associated EpsI family protein [Phycisphaerales bacterium JB059]
MKRSLQKFVAFGVALGIMGMGAAGFSAAISKYRLHLQKLEIYPPGGRQLSQLPVEVPGWERFGSDQVEDADVLSVLGTENYVSRTYVESDPEDPKNPFRIELHAAYYTGMIDTVPHVPERCFVGGGLQQASSSRTIPLPMDTSSWRPDPSVPENLRGQAGALYTTRLHAHPYSDAPGTRVRLPREVTPESPIEMRVSEFLLGEKRRLYAGYFFVANGGTVPNANDVRTLAFDLTSDYAYYLKVQVTSASASSSEELAEKAASLLDGLMGEIMRCTPDWVEVELGNYPEDNPRRGADG